MADRKGDGARGGGQPTKGASSGGTRNRSRRHQRRNRKNSQSSTDSKGSQARSGSRGKRNGVTGRGRGRGLGGENGRGKKRWRKKANRADRARKDWWRKGPKPERRDDDDNVDEADRKSLPSHEGIMEQLMDAGKCEGRGWEVIIWMLTKPRREWQTMSDWSRIAIIVRQYLPNLMPVRRVNLAPHLGYHVGVHSLVCDNLTGDLYIAGQFPVYQIRKDGTGTHLIGHNWSRYDVRSTEDALTVTDLHVGPNRRLFMCLKRTSFKDMRIAYVQLNDAVDSTIKDRQARASSKSNLMEDVITIIATGDRKTVVHPGLEMATEDGKKTNDSARTEGKTSDESPMTWMPLESLCTLKCPETGETLLYVLDATGIYEFALCRTDDCNRGSTDAKSRQPGTRFVPRRCILRRAGLSVIRSANYVKDKHKPLVSTPGSSGSHKADASTSDSCTEMNAATLEETRRPIGYIFALRGDGTTANSTVIRITVPAGERKMASEVKFINLQTSGIHICPGASAGQIWARTQTGVVCLHKSGAGYKKVNDGMGRPFVWRSSFSVDVSPIAFDESSNALWVETMGHSYTKFISNA